MFSEEFTFFLNNQLNVSLLIVKKQFNVILFFVKETFEVSIQ